MDDPATATAKAAGEIAKTTGQALEIVHDTGGYLNRVFGDLPDNAVGLLGADWLRERRHRNLDALRRRTAEILRERDVQSPIELSPNQATELLTAAQDESRETFAELWARLLANAMDPSMNNVRRSFIEAVRKMDPMDALVIRFISDKKLVAITYRHNLQPNSTHVGDVADLLCSTIDNILVSLDHLYPMLFLDKMRQANGGHDYHVTAANREFIRACYPEN